uniref:Uncharacterized protein n=1 Tax=Rhizophora mucronata TaxID=61149 RepID=A0A2P2Q017_RHIMU
MLYTFSHGIRIAPFLTAIRDDDIYAWTKSKFSIPSVLLDS